MPKIGTAQPASYLSSNESFFYEDDSCLGVMKQYQGRQYAFVGLLPNEGISLDEFVDSLTGEKLQSLLYDPQHGIVHTRIPKFEGAQSYELAEPLMEMGMADAFSPETADFSGMAPLCPVEVWYDTAAPMCGENGPVKLFGLQKGLEDGQMPAAEAWMGHVSQLYSKARGVDAANLPGAGAAGGIGGALAAVLGADMFPGGGKVVELSGMRQFIIESGDALEAVVTGEGHFDAQTLTGKLPAVVAITARDAAAHKPLVVCAAGIADDLQQDLFDKVISISEGAGPLQEAMQKPVAMKNLKASVKLAMR